MGYFSYFSEPSLAFVGPLVSIGQARLDRTLVPRPRGGRESGMVSREGYIIPKFIGSYLELKSKLPATTKNVLSTYSANHTL